MCALKASYPPHTTTTSTTTAAAAAAAAAAANTNFSSNLLEVSIVTLVIFKRLNPGAAEDGAEDVLVVRRHLPAAEPTPRLPLGDT